VPALEKDEKRRLNHQSIFSLLAVAPHPSHFERIDITVPCETVHPCAFFETKFSPLSWTSSFGARKNNWRRALAEQWMRYKKQVRRWI